jgi:uncharacterized phage protein (TIGR01671 family)
MRTIKFSCMWTDGKSWMDLRYTLDQMCNGEHWDAMSDQPLLKKFAHQETRQFTGLQDNNGVEIYEGDLLGSSNFIWQVKWQDNGGFVGVIKGNPTYSVHVVIRKRKMAGCPIEVIGNIHATPELIEAAK